jgi:hypothetical protein
VRWLGLKLNGHRAHDIQEVVVSHSWVPLYRVCGTFVHNALFPSPLFAMLSFFHNFKERLKATALVWCPDNGSVTHEHLVEMRSLAHDCKF